MYVLSAKLTETRPADVARDAWRNISRNAMQALADHWHENMLDDHFKPQATAKYRHQLRGRSYRKRKAWLASQGRPWAKGGKPIIMGGVVDNVLTGYMREQLKQNAAIMAYPTRATLKMYGPRYMTMRVFRGDARRAIREGWTYGRGQKFSSRSGANQPDKVKEITTITSSQMRELAAVAETAVQRQLRSYRAPRTTTI